MAEDGKIVVELNLNVKESGGTDNLDLDNNLGQTPDTEISAKSMSQGVNSSTSKMVATYVGTQALKWATSNYGNLTGDYVTQANINEGIAIAGMGIAMAQSPIMGGLAAATALTVKGIGRMLEIREQEQRAQSIRERVGTIISTGGRDL